MKRLSTVWMRLDTAIDTWTLDTAIDSDGVTCIQLTSLGFCLGSPTLTIQSPSRHKHVSSSSTVVLHRFVRFYNAEDDQLDWRLGQFRGRGRAFEEKLAETTGRSRGLVPQGHFLFVGEPSARHVADTAVLRAHFTCQHGSANLSFDFWRSSENLEIRICTRRLSDAAYTCAPAIKYNVSLPISVPVWAPVGPFYLDIVVSGVIAPSVLLLDNLVYTADLCEHDHKTTTVSVEEPLDTTDDYPWQLESESSNECDVLTCDFSVDQCKYSNSVDTNKRQYFYSGQWKLGTGNIGNPKADIKKSNGENAVTTKKAGFSYIGKDRGFVDKPVGTVYALESPTFTLFKETRLIFDLYQRSGGVHLEVCLNSMTNCPYHNPALVPGQHWYERQVVRMPSDTYKVFFVATQRQENDWLAIDNVRVDGRIGCPAVRRLFTYRVHINHAF